MAAVETKYCSKETQETVKKVLRPFINQLYLPTAKKKKNKFSSIKDYMDGKQCSQPWLKVA